MDVGFEQAGVDIVAANDSWDVAMQTYALNRPGTGTEICAGPLAEHRPRLVQLARSERADVVFGGPPCQDFSSAGWRRGDGPRADQTAAFVDTTLEIAPEFMVMENVNTILSTGRRHYEAAMRRLARAGYATTTLVLNALDLGAPQRRRRCIMIARKRAGMAEADTRLDERRGPHLSVKDYYPGIARGPDRTEYFYAHPYRPGNRRGVFSTDEYSPTLRSINRPIPPGYKPAPGDATTDMGRVRPLTEAERAIVQTFPPDYQFTGCRTAQNQQIGNAVPPLMARAVAEAMFRS